MQNLTPASSDRSRPSSGSGRAAPRATATFLPGVGSLEELVGLMGSPRISGDCGASVPRVPVLHVQPDAVLLHEGSPGHILYVVRSGSFKCVRNLEDGYELVLSFPQPGELLGFEALHAGGLHASARALEHATVYALPIAELHDLQRRCPPLERAVRTALSRQLARAGEAAEMMAPVASDARLARFLLWLSARMAEAGQSPRRLRLRMPRRDIGSLLGLAHETISRSLTMLADCGCLRVDKRDVEILDIEALRVRARNTRGLHAEALARPPGPRTAQASSDDGWRIAGVPVAA